MSQVSLNQLGGYTKSPKMIGHWPQVVYIPKETKAPASKQPVFTLKNKHLLSHVIDSIDGELHSCSFFQTPLPEEPKPPPKAGCRNIENSMGWPMSSLGH